MQVLSYQIKVKRNIIWYYVVIQYKKEAGIFKINQQVKKALCNCIIQHNQVVEYPISNYCLRLPIAGQVGP